MLLDVKDQVRGLKEDLELMQQFLQNADANADINDISTVINQIRKLAYDVEDIIDTYILKFEAKANVCGKKGCFLKYLCFLRTAPQAYCIGRKIQSRQGKVKRISDILIDSGVRRIAKAGEDLTSSSSRERYSKKKPRNYPYDDDDDGGDLIVGLDKDIKMLVQVLMGEGKTQVKFVSIVGMGGSGKTTLARKLYNHPFTKDCFDCFAWVYISETWSTRHILSEILRKVSSPTEVCNLNAESSMNALVDKLRSILEKKLYLVVLDDVGRKEVLVDILPAFPRVSSNKGSKIIITTRNEEVVLQFQNLQRHLYVHKPMPLSKEESWELFCKITSNHHTNCNDKTYKDLGQEMLKKCDGLPLAIVALAGILNTKTNIYEWQQVSKAVRSRVMEGTCTHQYGKVGEMLALSFDDLPCDLKPCFLYLGVFSEDCQIPAGMLIRMWIAEGFITANDAMSPEDVAMQYIEELSHRFMIQVVRTNMKGEIKAIHLHDLLRVLCIKKAQEQGFLQVKNLPSSDESPVAFQSRRASLHSSMSIPKQASKLRSLVILTRSSVTHSAYESKESFNFKIIHHKFKLLRLLNLWGIKTTTGGLPSEIGNLIHLRYLGIRASNVTEFPTSIGKLRNLLTLDYRNVDCSDKNVELPNVLCKLVLLRHLFLPDDCPWTREELKLSALRNLQILWGVKCGGGDWFSREMLELSTTISKLKVIVSTEKNLEAVFDSPSIFSNHLHTFHCEWSVDVALKYVNHAISQNQHIHKLVLVGQINVEKLSLILPPNLLILELKDSILENEDIMVVAGALAHLKLLRLSNSYMGTTFTCNFGSFLQLEELYLENLQNLAMWTIKKGAMSSLKKLEILNCQSLHFPQGLVFVTTLQQLEYFGVPKKFGEEARVHGWSQKRLRLPHNYEAIIEQCDDPVDMSSIHKLYEQLTAGIFLNNRTKASSSIILNNINVQLPKFPYVSPLKCWIKFSNHLSVSFDLVSSCYYRSSGS
ncbi:probable disease resistance protein RXW24L [Chenopodium quinoa]|uniref:probable disease resistance protein RXW24L n=1 Tax=Chenopodium quinoa TaxID=63459 RepID=UPI000B77E3AD|nr:probable disease resistance protein RXW24L [Chenopodium quinoa]